MNCVEANINMIEQIISLLDQMEDAQYGQGLEIFNGSSIGQHLRHIYEFYLAVGLNPLDASINYNDRKRDPIIELSTDHASSEFITLVEQIRHVDSKKPVKVISCFDLNSDEGEAIDSTIGRELMFVYDHALHHLAMVRMGIQQAFPNIKLPFHFGVAISTIKATKA